MKFSYSARTQEGVMQAGVVEAPTREAALGVLQRENLLALSLDEQTSGLAFNMNIHLFQRVKPVEIVVFSRQLAVLFDAQVPMLSALHSLADQTNNLKFKKVINEIADQVDAGTALSDALANFPKLFSDFYVNVVKAGEASGRLTEVLTYLADHVEKNYDLNRKVRGALIYPLFVVGAIVIVASIMMIFVVPQLTAIFEESNAELPFLTRLVIGISDFMIAFWWLMIVLFIGAVVGLVRFVKTDDGRQIWDTMLLNLPVFKNLFRKLYLARMSENLSTLIKGGIPILQSLDITAKVVGNRIYSATIFEAGTVVERGGAMSEVFERNKYIPKLVVQMVSVGEKSGQLDSMLGKVADFYKKDVDNLVENLTEIIQPVLILILGAAAGILVAAILLPIYNLTSAF